MDYDTTLVTAITAAAVSIAEDKCSRDIAILGCAFAQLGDTLTTISQQMDNMDNAKAANTPDA